MKNYFILSCIQITIASIVSATLGVFPDVKLVTFSAVMAISAFLASTVLWIGSRSFEVKIESEASDAPSIH